MYMKYDAMNFLLASIESPVLEIIKQDKDCEIDPSRLRNPGDAQFIDDRVNTLESELTYIEKG